MSRVSQCYKTFFGGNLENLDFPFCETAQNKPFLNTMNNFRVLLFDLQKAQTFCHFVHVQAL